MESALPLLEKKSAAKSQSSKTNPKFFLDTCICLSKRRTVIGLSVALLLSLAPPAVFSGERELNLGFAAGIYYSAAVNFDNLANIHCSQFVPNKAAKASAYHEILSTVPVAQKQELENFMQSGQPEKTAIDYSTIFKESGLDRSFFCGVMASNMGLLLHLTKDYWRCFVGKDKSLNCDDIKTSINIINTLIRVGTDKWNEK
jgi:hypothetical protein